MILISEKNWEVYKNREINECNIKNMLFKYEVTGKFIQYIFQNNYAILGGDVYKIMDNEFLSTGDNWYINKNEKDFISKSRERTIMYINNYYNKNGGDFYYAFVIFKALERKKNTNLLL